MSDPPVSTEFVRPRTEHHAPVHLVEPNPSWPEEYARVADRVEAALGTGVVEIEHIGSTAVTGLPAKPIIDICLVVADPADEPSYVPGLEHAGFLLHLREPAWHQHRLLKGSDPAVNLHVFGPVCPEVDRMLLFRDRLRANRDERMLYAHTKRELASRTWAYVQDYADAKSEVVEAIIGRALAERAATATGSVRGTVVDEPAQE